MLGTLILFQHFFLLRNLLFLGLLHRYCRCISTRGIIATIFSSISGIGEPLIHWPIAVHISPLVGPPPSFLTLIILTMPSKVVVMMTQSSWGNILTLCRTLIGQVIRCLDYFYLFLSMVSLLLSLLLSHVYYKLCRPILRSVYEEDHI